MKSVSFLICNQMLASSVTLPLEQFKAAEAMYRASGKSKRQKPINFQLVSNHGKTVKTHSSIQLSADSALTNAVQTDIVYLPAIWRNPQAQIKANPEILDWLRYIYAQGTIIAGVGTGCCFLAEAGLLDNQIATTHWHYFDEFERRYPAVNLQRQFFITASDRIYCTGSTNSLADLTVFFIKNHFGEAIANNVEQHFFHEIRQNYLKTTSTTNQAGLHSDELIARVQAYINENLINNHNIQQLSERFKLSVRTLNRRFKAATGKSPIQYIQRQRIALAADLLKNTNLSASEIAYHVGYFDMAHFTSLFKREFHITPNQYRTTVRAKLFSVDNP